MRRAHVSQIQSLQNSRQDKVNMRDKMNRIVFILKVGDRWVRFFCLLEAVGKFTCRADTGVGIK